MGAKKIISLFVLGTFAAFEWSCVTSGLKPKRLEDAVAKDVSQVDPTNVKTKVLGVVKNDGKKILFPQEAPGRFDPRAKAVVGVALQQFVFAKNEVVIVRDKKKGVVRSVTTRDGRFYEVLSALDEGDNIRVNAYAPISIPLSDIRQVSVLKRAGPGEVTFLAIVGIVGGVAIGYLFYRMIKPLVDITKDPTIR
jgi:hypothetical protein